MLGRQPDKPSRYCGSESVLAHLATETSRQNVHMLWEIGVAESISTDKFVTGSRINVLAVHVHTLSSQKSPKTALHAQNDSVFIGKPGH